jgi:TonB family protein
MPDCIRKLCIAGLLCVPLAHGVCQDDPQSSLEHYRLAQAYLQQKNYQSAANEFREALNGDLKPAWTESWSHIQLARIFEASGQHDRAVNEYRQARQADVAQALFAIGKPIQMTDPEYTGEARVAELEGTVVLRGSIGEDGLAHDLDVLEPLGLGLDEKAIEAVKQWSFQPAVNQQQATGRIAVSFRLSTKQSRWHLIRVQFDTPPGISRPIFASALYPIGAGLGPEAMEEGRLVAAMRRLATAKLTFDVDEHGVPVHFQVPNSSEAVWGSEATALVAQWRFAPGMKNGIAVSVPCTVELVWGARELDLSKLAQVRQSLEEQTPDAQTAASSDAVPPSPAGPGSMGVVRIAVDAEAQAAKLVVWVPPEYRSAARATGLRGTVRLRVLIDVDGRVREAEVLDGDPGLAKAAAECVKEWMYLPTLLNGTPVEVTTEAEVDVGPAP